MRYRWLAALCAGLLADHARGAPKYHVVPIGDLPGGSVYSRPYSINNLGEVVGASIISDNGGYRAFYWSAEAGIIDLGLRNDIVSSSTATDINNHGQIVGFTIRRAGGFLKKQASYWNASLKHSFAHSFSSLSGQHISILNAINDDGVAVGTRPTGLPGETGAFWIQILSGEIGVLDLSLDAGALDITNNGIIVGYVGPYSGEPLDDPFIDGSPAPASWQLGLAGTRYPCAGLPCEIGIAEAASPDGTIFGSQWTDDLFSNIGLRVYPDGSYGWIDGGDFVRIVGANARGDHVVWSWNAGDAHPVGPNGKAVVDGVLHSLKVNLYSDDGSWAYFYPFAINDRGWIAAQGGLPNGDVVAVLLRPVGECPAELTFDGKQDFFDVAEFVRLYSEMDPLADLAAPFGVFNFFDFAEFIASFNAGCPG